MTFETLGARTVLSISNPLGAAVVIDPPHLEMPIPRFDDRAEGLDAGHGPSGSPQAGFGPLDAFGPAPRYEDRPPASMAYLPANGIVGGYSLGAGSGVLYVTIVGGPRSPSASILWFDFGGPAASPPPPAAPPAARASTSVSSALGVGVEALAAESAKGLGARDSAGESILRSVGSATLAAVSPTASAVGLQAVQSAQGNLQFVPNAGESALLRGAHPDEAPPAAGGSSTDSRATPGLNDPEGGPVELPSPRRGGTGLAAPGTLNELPTAPKRGRQSDGRIEGDVDPDEPGQALEPAGESGAVDPAGALDDDRQRVADASSPANLGTAKFDDGGMIELTAGGIVGRAGPAIDGTHRSQFEVTFESGVAMFQAFELGSEPGAAPVAQPATEPQPRSSDRSVGDDEAGEDESESTPRRAAANLGLGLLLVVPYSLNEKRSDDERPSDRQRRWVRN